MMANFNLSVRHKQWVVMGGVGPLLILIGWLAVIRPLVDEIKSSRQRVIAATQYSNLINEIYAFRMKREKFEKGLPFENERHMILGQIAKLSNDSQLDVQSLTPTLNEAKDLPYSVLTIDMQVRASFQNLVRFFAALGKTKTDFVVTQVTIDRSSSEFGRNVATDRLLKATFKLQTYLKKK